MQRSDILQIFLTSSIIILILVMGIVLFVLYYQRRLLKQRDDMEEMKEAHQLSLQEANLESQEREQQRIASDLHDGLGALLSTVKMRMLRASKLGDPDYNNSTADILDEGIQSLRQIAHELSPANLERLGLVPAIEVRCEQLEKAGDIRFTINSSGMQERLPAKPELALYRIILELINNTLKHAYASEVQIELIKTTEMLSLLYKDNGRGFDVKNVATGIGLLNLQSRVNVLKGTFNIESAPGNGATFSIQIPLTNN